MHRTYSGLTRQITHHNISFKAQCSALPTHAPHRLPAHHLQTSLNPAIDLENWNLVRLGARPEQLAAAESQPLHIQTQFIPHAELALFTCGCCGWLLLSQLQYDGFERRHFWSHLCHFTRRLRGRRGWWCNWLLRWWCWWWWLHHNWRCKNDRFRRVLRAKNQLAIE